MADPGSNSRVHGLGDDAQQRHYSKHKRTRGEEAQQDMKRVKRRYDNDSEDGNGDRRDRSGRRDRGSRKRSLSPPPHEGSYRERRQRSPHDGYASQSKRRDDRHANSATNLNRRPERSPSISPSRHHHHRRHRHNTSNRSPPQPPAQLPFDARPLVRSDLSSFRPLFAQYLEVQKCKDIAALDEREVRGRWKSFVRKWNSGELAEGWYQAETLAEARKSYPSVASGNVNVNVDVERVSSRAFSKEASREEHTSGDGEGRGIGLSHSYSRSHSRDEEEREGEGKGKGSDDDDDEDDYGPTLPPPGSTTTRDASYSTKHHGPGIPNLQDLDLRREEAREEAKQEHLQSIADLRLARKADRVEQRARLEELVPRAEPGTRERKLEKKREVNDKIRAFRDGAGGSGVLEEVGEAELMGGGDSVAEYRKVKETAERRKTEREVRREEELRARMAEREERLREYKKKEEGTMEVLKRIARERFG